MSHERGFAVLQDLIQTKSPFFIGRLSGIETNFCGLKLAQKSPDASLIQLMQLWAGIYLTTNEDATKYTAEYTSAVDSCDMLGVWDGSMYTQAIDFYDYARDKYSHKYIPAQSLEPYYYFNEPSYRPLFVNKTILVITSHEHTIRQQVINIDSIFPKKIFENCRFIVVRAPLQYAECCDGRPWTAHFEELKNKIRGLKFDVALVGCGGFGMPICNFIYKEMNSSALYVGGALQLFFGVIGTRWLSSTKIRSLRNSSWCWPLANDKPRGFLHGESQSYW
jgi:hypothetical protein